MEKHIAKLLRDAAEKIDPTPAPRYPHGVWVDGAWYQNGRPAFWASSTGSGGTTTVTLL